jgi:hypothetical protein
MAANDSNLVQLQEIEARLALLRSHLESLDRRLAALAARRLPAGALPLTRDILRQAVETLERTRALLYAELHFLDLPSLWGLGPAAIGEPAAPSDEQSACRRSTAAAGPAGYRDRGEAESRAADPLLQLSEIEFRIALVQDCLEKQRATVAQLTQMGFRAGYPHRRLQSLADALALLERGRGDLDGQIEA